MSTNVEKWPELPGYWEVIRTTFECLQYQWKQDRHEGGFIAEIDDYCSLTQTEISLVILSAVVFTIGRYFTSKYIFLPWAKRSQIPKRDQVKVPESAYKSLFYTSVWILMFYIIFWCHEHIFRDPISCFKDWEPKMEVPFGIRLVYGLQASFYVHSVFATLFMDAWRKDSYMMLIHHFLTLSLVGFSYASRYHNIGLLVFFLHDVTDVFLENSKLLIYFKIRKGKKYPINDKLANIGFTGFSLTWFWFRLYWFPLKAIWSGASVGLNDVYMPFVILLNSMLWVLLLMNIWWFTFIISMLCNLITGQSTEIDDIREDDIVPSEKKLTEMLMVGNGKHKQNGLHSKSNGKAVQNGTVLMHRRPDIVSEGL